MPLKTTDELKAQARVKGIAFYPVHNCGICGYLCGYIINGEEVAYDSGCRCVSYSNIQPRSWEELTDSYNMNQPENNPDISRSFLESLNNTWKFDDVAKQLEEKV